MVRVDVTIAPGLECPRDDQDWRPRAGVTRPAGLSVDGGGTGSLRGGGTQLASMGPFRILFSSDCHPAGPAGPYVAGGPVGPDDLFKVLEPLEHSVLDHADPAGQHAVIQDVLEPLEHSVLDTVLDGRPMERQFWNR